MLSDTPRQKLAAMIALDGFKVASDEKLCEALLRNYCGEYRVEIAALTAAVRLGIPKSLGEAGMVPPATLRANLARRLQENHGLAEDAAYWAVDAWASVLGPSSGTPETGQSKNTSDVDATAAWSARVSLPPQQPSPRQQQAPQQQSPALPPPVDLTAPWSAQAVPVSPLPQQQSPALPPPPKPPSQRQQAPVPSLPKPLSEPQLAPPPYQPQSQLPALAFVPAAQAFENRETTPQLRELQSYLKKELKTRKSSALIEELRRAGVEALTAKRLVAQAGRTTGMRHTWIALTVFAVSALTRGMVVTGATGSNAGDTSVTVVIFTLLFWGALMYVVYCAARLIRTYF